MRLITKRIFLILLTMYVCIVGLHSQNIDFETIEISAQASNQGLFEFTSYQHPYISGDKLSVLGDQLYIVSLGGNLYNVVLSASETSFNQGWESELIYYPSVISGAYTIRKIRAITNDGSNFAARNTFDRRNTNEQIIIDAVDAVAAFSSAGGLYVKGITSSTHCEIELLDDDFVKFTPEPDFEGIAQFQFLVCDAADHCEELQIELLLTDHLSFGESDTIEIVLVNDESGTIPVPLYDFEVTDDADIVYANLWNSEVSVSGVNDHNITDYMTLESDELTLTLKFTQLSVPTANKLVSSDIMEIGKIYNVLKNDFSQYLVIDTFSTPGVGVLRYLGTGNFRYAPGSDFNGKANFWYKVCANGSCETANVLIRYKQEAKFQKAYHFSTTKDVPVIPGINSQDFEEGTTMTIVNSASNGLAQFVRNFYIGGCQAFEVSGVELIYQPTWIGNDYFDLEICRPNLPCDTLQFSIEIKNSDPESCGCIESCVWPGDVNTDGQVDMSDLLALGQYVGEHGTARDEIDSEWKSHYASSWNEYGMLGYEARSFDANGDGIISELDVEAIAAHFGRMHEIPTNTFEYNEVAPFNLDNGQSPLEAGDLVLMDINLGNVDYPALDLSGVSFEINYDSEFIDESSVFLNFYENSWLIDRSPELELVHKASKGKIEAGVTRIGHNLSSGYGLVAQMGFIIVDDLDGFKLAAENVLVPIHITLKNGRGMSANGDIITLPNAELTVFMSRDGILSEQVSADKLLTYPNPSSDYLSLHLNGKHEMLSYKIYDVTGRLIQREDLDGNHSEINIQNLESGLHVLEVQTTNGPLSKKIQVANL